MKLLVIQILEENTRICLYFRQILLILLFNYFEFFTSYFGMPEDHCSNKEKSLKYKKIYQKQINIYYFKTVLQTHTSI